MNNSTPTSQHEIESQFHAFMVENGFSIDELPIADSKMHRFKVEGDKPSTQNGWYILFDDAPYNGKVGSNKTGEKLHWKADIKHSSTVHPLVIKQKKEQRKLEETEQRKAARNKATDIWNKSVEVERHFYLENKHVKAFGIRQNNNSLVVPLRNVDDEIQTLQFINNDKKFLSGGSPKGNFHLIGDKQDTIVICEGYATGASIHQATKLPIAVAFNANNLLPVAENLKQKYPDIDFIVAADNDQWTDGNPGMAKATEAALKINAKLTKPQFKNLDAKLTDFNDLATQESLADVTLQLDNAQHVQSESAPEPKEKFKFKLTLACDLGDPAPINWLIENFIADKSLSCIYGPPCSMKSFQIIDWGCHIAAGKRWNNRKTKQGTVVYISGEGGSEIKNRIHAWCKHHNHPINKLPFYVSNGAVSMLEDNSANELIQLVDEIPDVRLIILDTLNRNFGDGDENSTKDMTRFIGALTTLQQHTQAAINVVHHTGKDLDKGARGNSAFRAALDAEFSFKSSGESESVTLKTTKQKDAEQHRSIVFNPKKIILAKETDYAKEVASIVLVIDRAAEMEKEVGRNFAKEGSNKRTYRTVLGDFVANDAGNTPHRIAKRELNKLLKSKGVDPTNTHKLHQWSISEGLISAIGEKHFQVVANPCFHKIKLQTKFSH